ncbi:MAG: hypothetical protein IJA30_01020 [Bacilli bacterium]|nr:hypothetical protein [Bacilli bacterium]
MVFGSVKGYGIQQISLKMLENKKWNFSELEIKDSDIKNEIKSVIENGGTVFALEKKKIFKAVYLFKLVNDSDDKYLSFAKKIVLDEIIEDAIKEFEDDMTTLLGEAVAGEEVSKVIWGEKEIELSKIKIGKLEIPLSIIWMLMGILFWLLFDDFMWFVIYLCIGVSSGYAVKINEPKRKLKKSKKKTKEKK